MGLNPFIFLASTKSVVIQLTTNYMLGGRRSISFCLF